MLWRKYMCVESAFNRMTSANDDVSIPRREDRVPWITVFIHFLFIVAHSYTLNWYKQLWKRIQVFGRCQQTVAKWWGQCMRRSNGEWPSLGTTAFEIQQGLMSVYQQWHPSSVAPLTRQTVHTGDPGVAFLSVHSATTKRVWSSKYNKYVSKAIKHKQNRAQQSAKLQKSFQNFSGIIGRKWAIF